jgi:hypothetical protein
MTTFYEILSVTDSSSPQEIKKRYRKLSSQCHPDKGGSNALFKLLAKAYEAIKANNGNANALGENTHVLHLEISSLRSKTDILENQVALVQKELAEAKKLNTTDTENVHNELRISKTDLREAKLIAIDKHKQVTQLNEIVTDLCSQLKTKSKPVENSVIKVSHNAIVLMLIVFIIGFAIVISSYDPAIKEKRSLYSTVWSSSELSGTYSDLAIKMVTTVIGEVNVIISVKNINSECVSPKSLIKNNIQPMFFNGTPLHVNTICIGKGIAAVYPRTKKGRSYLINLLKRVKVLTLKDGTRPRYTFSAIGFTEALNKQLNLLHPSK